MSPTGVAAAMADPTHGGMVGAVDVTDRSIVALPAARNWTKH